MPSATEGGGTPKLGKWVAQEFARVTGQRVRGVGGGARLILCTALVLQGCVPWGYSYERIEAPEAVYFKSSCWGGVGPPSLVYYPFHGIFISLGLNPIQLGLHVPAGATAALNGATLAVFGRTNGGDVRMTIDIRASPHSYVGSSDPKEFGALPDPFKSDTTFGPLNGASRDERSVWYLFTERIKSPPSAGVLTTEQLVDRIIEGSVKLPAITVNGKLYDPEVLPFKRESWVAVMPVNC